MKNLNGKIVIVTGGSGMLGSRYIEAVKEIGGYPISLDIHFPKDNKVLDDSFHIDCDISKEEDIIEALSYIKENYDKPIYGLINNVTLDFKLDNTQKNAPPTALEGYPSDFFDKEIATGIRGTFLCTKHFGGEMVKNGKGSIINIASILGIVAPNQNFYRKLGTIKPFGYTTVKSAIVGMSRHIATEWGQYGIRSNCLALGGVYNNHPEDFVDKLIEFIPLKRMANKDEYNGIIKFLLSEESSYLTGATIPVDGGFTAC